MTMQISLLWCSKEREVRLTEAWLTAWSEAQESGTVTDSNMV